MLQLQLAGILIIAHMGIFVCGFVLQPTARLIRRLFNYPARLVSILFLLFILTLPIHEYAHTAVCVYYALEPEINFFEAATTCESIPVEAYLPYWITSGGIAGLVFVVPLAVKQVREHTEIKTELSIVGTTQGVNALVETFMHDGYIVKYLEARVLLAILAIFIFALVVYNDRSRIRGTAPTI